MYVQSRFINIHCRTVRYDTDIVECEREDIAGKKWMRRRIYEQKRAHLFYFKISVEARGFLYRLSYCKIPGDTKSTLRVDFLSQRNKAKF